MPAKINMFISNGNIFPQQQISTPQQQIPVPKINNKPLNAGMIARIHSIKPGCGGCGRKAY
jgi:hypothetical protein